MGAGHPQLGAGHPQLGAGQPQLGAGHPQLGAGQPQKPAQPRPRKPAWLRRLTRRLRPRRIVVIGAALLVLGVFAAGFGLGWTSSRLAGPGDLPDTQVTVVAPPSEAGEAVSRLPDVRGLLLADAQQAMVDAGLPPEAVKVADAPAALPAGTIVRQDPIGGTVGATAVTLYSAVPGTVPMVVGTQAAAAVQALSDLGTAVRQVAKYTPGTAEGTVVAVEPAEGQPLAAEVVLTVSGPASSIYLADVDATSGRCNTGAAGVNGTQHEHSVACPLRENDSTTVYLLNRQVTNLQGTLGVADDSDAGAQAAVRITIDGRVLLDTTVGYGTATPFDLDVHDGLRLEITYSTPAPDADGRLVLGDARLVGDPAAIDALDHQ